MENMKADLTLAENMQINLEEYLNLNPQKRPKIAFNVRAIDSTFWPSYKSPIPKLPAELKKCVSTFEIFYREKVLTMFRKDLNTSKRNLPWIYNVGTCTICSYFKQKTVKLDLTALQAAVLMVFNDADVWSFSAIKRAVDLNDDDLTEVLYSLTMGKCKILKK
ncbi:hypothetical protein Syun_023147 [Stephania yunnanensis]|uniref:Cullin family profile domain-containing protein n=1 Tax=Stephania yunnanensis TaxID=152371 RepID=A0AAP0F8E8_9MAGN